MSIETILENEESMSPATYVCVPLTMHEIMDTKMQHKGQPREGEVLFEGETFIVPVVVLKNSDNEINQPSSRHKCRIGNTLYPLLSAENTKAEFCLLPDLEKQDQNNTKAGSLLIPALIDFLNEVGKIYGLSFSLHLTTPTGFYEPMREEKGVLHVFMGCTPMPQEKRSYPEKLFGMNAETGGLCHRLFAPSQKRGTALTDGTQDVVQVVGNNIYILFDPLLLSPLGEKSMLVIFTKAIVLAMNWWVKREETTPIPKEPESSLTPEAAESLMLAYFKSYETAFADAITESESKIKNYEKKLTDARRERLQYKRILRVLFTEGHLRDGLALEMLEDQKRIVSNPLVESTRLIADLGFEFRTKKVTITHEGTIYLIAESFVCRFGIDGSIHIWAEGSHHPKGISHPHISPAFGVCFGNASDIIESAVAEFRYGDAVEYTLMWLTEGYSPEHALFSKIEEWPIEKTQTEHEAVTC